MCGISIGHSLPRPCSGNKTLRRCRTKEEADNVIFIDVDAETSDDAVIIDIPESLPKRNEESHVPKKDKNWLFRNVINIDDDDEDETPDSRSPFGADSVGFSAGTSLNREGFHVAEDFVDSTVKDCQFVQDSATPVRLSKCRRTYSGKASTSNHYGLDSDSEYDLSVDDYLNDYPDCDLVEDFSGHVQESWEKAVARRRKDTHNDRSGIRVQGSTSSCINKDHQNADLNHLSNNDAVNDQEYSDCLKVSIAGDKENSNKEDKDGQLHMETRNSLSPAGACIGRENHKETDVYRKAMEQEYARREEAVRIEAEKAQNEKRAAKRRKAESMRLLNMERRQKQRLEEMRSIQKKDEDNMNMKDTIRAEIRNELKQLEVGCGSMAFLLHSLGIKVGSWPNSSPQEVQVAYKRALLTFHPDRADTSDIRKLVEAEEKFKLINRIKGKFPSF